MLQDKAEILGDLDGRDGGEEFSLGRGGGSDGLHFGVPGDGVTIKKENIPGGGATLVKIVSMGRVDISNKFKKGRGLGHGWGKQKRHQEARGKETGASSVVPS